MSKADAIATGPRVLQIGRLVTGSAIGLLFVLASIPVWRSVDWPLIRLRLSPATSLMADIKRGGPFGSVAAKELSRRVDAGSYEGDEAKLSSIFRTFRPLTARGRQTAVAGDKIPVDIALTPDISITTRVSDEPTKPRYAVYTRFVGHRIGDGPWVESGFEFSMGRPLLTLDSGHLRLDVPATLPPGPTTLRVKYEIIVVRLADLPESERGRLIHKYSYYDIPGYREHFPAAYAWEQEAAIPFTTLPPGSTDVALVVGPSSRPAMAGTIQIAKLPQLHLRDPEPRAIRVRRNRSGYTSSEWGIEFGGVPVAVAADMIVRDTTTGAEATLGQVLAAAGRRGISYYGNGTDEKTSEVLAAFKGETVDVILRPSTEAARKTSQLHQIWGEEIVIPSVPLFRIEPEIRPAE